MPSEPVCPECKSDHVLLDNLGGYRCSDCEYRWPESNQQEPVKRYAVCKFEIEKSPDDDYPCVPSGTVDMVLADDYDRVEADNKRLQNAIERALKYSGNR